MSRSKKTARRLTSKVFRQSYRNFYRAKHHQVNYRITPLPEIFNKKR